MMSTTGLSLQGKEGAEAVKVGAEFTLAEMGQINDPHGSESASTSSENGCFRYARPPFGLLLPFPLPLPLL